MLKLTTRKHAKRREMTWEYAKGVDGVNKNRWSRVESENLNRGLLGRRLERAVARADADSDQSVLVRAMSALAELDAVSALTPTVHERAKHSPAVGTVHQAFHDVLIQSAADGLKSAGMSDGDARMRAATIIAVVEGIHLHEPSRDPEARNHLVQWLIQRLTAPSGFN
jgi:hypothetical protein